MRNSNGSWFVRARRAGRICGLSRISRVTRISRVSRGGTVRRGGIDSKNSKVRRRGSRGDVGIGASVISRASKVRFVIISSQLPSALERNYNESDTSCPFTPQKNTCVFFAFLFFLRV